MVGEIKQAAAAIGREIEVFTVGQMVCRPTQKEADEYYRHAIIEQADWGAVDGMLHIKNITPQTIGEEEYKKKREYFAAKAIGGYPFVGTPDKVAQELADLSRGGVRGIGISLVNYLAELPYVRDEVLPRLQRMGVRQPA
jgi:alkanesulfonate monooxygenase SsuD/methylene tetrahydromethanopterin reductase-like flavin-dependent oxidoreductase (luciferase family)